jgi:hypothetical protein
MPNLNSYTPSGEAGNLTIEEEEIEVRDLIHLNISKITPNGEVTVQFSEKLMSIEDFEEKGVNMTVLNAIKDGILDV